MSFKKRLHAPQGSKTSQNTPLPDGVRISPNTGSPVTSWGLRPIDAAIGGGLPLGTLTILIEDHPSSYYRALCSYVIAQGIHSSHAVAIASFDQPSNFYVDNLPARVFSQSPFPPSGSAPHRSAPHMKIAWRYQKNANPSTHITSGQALPSFAYDFDLSQHASIPSSAAISCLSHDIFSSSLTSLLEKLQMHLQNAASQNRLSRIIIHGLSTAYQTSKPDIELAEFLCRLRFFARVYGCVIVATCPPDVPYRLLSVTSDALLKIDSFEGRGAGVAGLGKEWLGVLVVKKTFREACAPSIQGKGDVWVFKRGRRKYTMERATTAPDEADEADITEKTQETSSSDRHNAMMGSKVCGMGPTTSKLDF